MQPIQLIVLSHTERQKLHEASLEVLNSVGVRVHDADLRRLMGDRGAHVDEPTQVVKLSADLVARQLSAAPKEFDLADRNGRRLPVPTEQSYIASRLLLPKILDYGSTEPREPLTRDIVRACQVANALKEVDLVVGIDVPVADVAPPEAAYLTSIKTVLMHTTKHLVCAPINSQAMEDWVALLEAATESGSLRDEPVMTVALAITSPLLFD